VFNSTRGAAVVPDPVRRVYERLYFGAARKAQARLSFGQNPDVSVEFIAALAADSDSDFGRLFYAHEGRLAHKWHHYLAIYDRILAPYRQGFVAPDGTTRPLRFLEIGVAQGGSLQLWRQFLGPDAVIFGIDIDPACKAADDGNVHVRIGSQADPAFLRAVVAEMGGVDVVLDDGSHIATHQRVSFDTLFPLVTDRGLYAIEDLQTAYWRNWEGGYHRRGTFIEVAKQLIDDMHAWYHPYPAKITNAKDEIYAMTWFDSVLAIEKRRKPQPMHIQRGSLLLDGSRRTP
jgi:hypothetical protein